MTKNLIQRDIRNWELFKRGRWPWNRYGYEDSFPRGCGFTDVDALVEFGGLRLMIEAKHWTGQGSAAPLPKGQRMALGREAEDDGKTVFVLWGNAEENNPLRIENLTTGEITDLRRYPIPVRQDFLRSLIDEAMGNPQLGN